MSRRHLAIWWRTQPGSHSADHVAPNSSDAYRGATEIFIGKEMAVDFNTVETRQCAGDPDEGNDP